MARTASPVFQFVLDRLKTQPSLSYQDICEQAERAGHKKPAPLHYGKALHLIGATSPKSAEPTQPKRRGRPPKARTMVEDRTVSASDPAPAPQPKRRGRKPKAASFATQLQDRLDSLIAQRDQLTKEIESILSVASTYSVPSQHDNGRRV